MKKYLLLFILNFSFTFSNVKAQCPEGDVQLLSQADVNNFLSSYPNCTHITTNVLLGEFVSPNSDIHDISGFINITNIEGLLFIIDTELTSLEGLQNLQELGSLDIRENDELSSIVELENITILNNGHLYLSHNPNLTSLQGLNNITHIDGGLYIMQGLDSLMSLSGLNSLVSTGDLVSIVGTNLSDLSGLNSLQSIGGLLDIGYNSTLKSLEGLNNLNFIQGSIRIRYNENLSNIAAIENLDLTSGFFPGLYIYTNESLSTCNYSNICEYLSWDSTEYPREITENTGNCADEQAVLAACGLGVTDVENDSLKWNVVYQKSKGSFIIQSNGFQIGEINIYDLSGKLVKTVQNLNSNREELRFFTPENVLIIKVTSKEGKVYAKKVLVK